MNRVFSVMSCVCFVFFQNVFMYLIDLYDLLLRLLLLQLFTNQPDKLSDDLL